MITLELIQKENDLKSSYIRHIYDVFIQNGYEPNNGNLTYLRNILYTQEYKYRSKSELDFFSKKMSKETDINIPTFTNYVRNIMINSLIQE